MSSRFSSNKIKAILPRCTIVPINKSLRFFSSSSSSSQIKVTSYQSDEVVCTGMFVIAAIDSSTNNEAIAIITSCCHSYWYFHFSCDITNQVLPADDVCDDPVHCCCLLLSKTSYRYVGTGMWTFSTRIFKACTLNFTPYLHRMVLNFTEKFSYLSWCMGRTGPIFLIFELPVNSLRLHCFAPKTVKT